MNEKKYTVYKHISPSGKVYIGITSMPVKRRWDNGRGYINNKYFYRAICKYGWDNFEHVILFEGLRKEEACLMEKCYIALYDSINSDKGYNINLGGYVLSEETKKKIGDSQRGEKHHLYGKHLSEETKRKMSEAHKGKFVSNETRKKLSNKAKGRKLSEETKRKMSEQRKGRTPWNKGKTFSDEYKQNMSNITKGRTPWNKGKSLSEEHKKRIGEAKKGKNNPSAKRVICLNTLDIFDTMKDAGIHFNVNPKYICDCCKGRQKTAGKHPETKERLRWMYYEEYLTYNKKAL